MHLDTRSLNGVSGTGKNLAKTEFRLRTSVSRSKYLKFRSFQFHTKKKVPRRVVSGPIDLDPETVDMA